MKSPRAVDVQLAPGAAQATRVFFTIVAWNYISYAATLMASIRRQHPEALRYVIVCGKPENRPDLKLDAEIMYPDQVDMPDVEAMTFVYDVMEYSTAVKPYAFLYFLNLHRGAHVLYTDPDLYLLKPLEHVFGPLAAGAGLVLTPHMMRPLQDGKEPSDLTIMKSGVYNLGFLGARADEESLLFIRWWAERCRRDAIVDIPNHKFTDQRWVDLAPAFVGSAYILRHPGYNIAYWNLASRRLAKRGRRYTANGEPIHFLHFSGVVPSNDKILSKHQNRFELGDLPVFAELLHIYLAEMLSLGWQATSKIKYEFNFFEDGRQIHKFMRASFRRHEGQEVLTGAEAFRRGEIFDQPEPSLERYGPPAITRAMYELWMARLDLQQAFNIKDATGRALYLSWFSQDGGKQAGFDDLSIEAARACASGAKSDAGSRELLEPWQPLSDRIVSGTPEEIAAWLADPVPIQIVMHGAGVYMPRILALLWEQRPDLTDHFILQDEAAFEAYLAWCITRGVLEKNVPIGLIGAPLAAYLGGVEGQQHDDSLPPHTRLARLAQGEYKGQFLELIKKSPEDLRSQLALVLWLCGGARAQYDWPLEMLKPLVEWLLRPSAYACADVWIPNVIYSCYRLRVDVQEAFKIWTPDGALQVVAWYIVFGSGEFSLQPDLLPPDMLHWLAQSNAQAGSVLSNFEYLVWLARPDVKATFDINEAEGMTQLHEWFLTEGVKSATLLVWIEILGLRARPAEDVVRCPVCLTGLWGSASGRGEDVRLTAAGLTMQGIDFIVFDRRSETFFSPQGEAIKADPSAVKINIVHLNADTALWDYIYLYRAGLSHAYNIGYWAWELERLPESWNFAYTVYNEVWAATHFTEAAFSRNQARPVRLMPMAVDLPETGAAITRDEFGFTEDDFVFYYGFDFRSYMARKNPEAAINAFLKAFGGTEKKVRLLLKTLAGDEDNDNFIHIKALASQDRRIVIVDREFTRPELYSLISQCNAFVSPHRSEGFGRGPAEAMLLGVPVIATNYSGNTDFTTPETALVIDYDLVPLAPGEYPGAEGQVWADIHVDKLAEAMARLADEPKTCRALAKAGRRFMTEHYAVPVISAQHAARIDELLAAKNAPQAVESTEVRDFQALMS